MYLHESTSDPVTFTPMNQESGKSQSIKAFSLDEAVLKQHAESTKEVQNVLAKIFEEESEDPAKEEVLQTHAAWHQGKLDEKHLALLEWILGEEEWPMDKVQQKCQ